MMKKILFLFSLLLLFSCGGGNKISENIPKQEIRIDTLKIVDTVQIAKLREENAQLRKQLDSLSNLPKTIEQNKEDKISYDAYIAQRKCIKIKYYISICEKNSKNKKFFYGWIKRTIDN